MTLNKPRLLIILNDAPFFITHRLPIAIAARNTGFEVHVATPFDEKSVSIMLSNGLFHHHIPLRRGTRNPFLEIWLILTLLRLIHLIKPQLLHCVTMKPVLYAGIIARFFKVPAVVNAITGLGYLFVTKGTTTFFQRKIIMSLYRLALSHPNSRAIFQNPDDLKLFLDNKLIESKKTTIIRGCGVDVNQFQARSEPEGTTVVMFPARILGDKGVNEFVEAARDLKSRGIHARFVLVGRTDPDNPTNVAEKDIQRWIDKQIVEWWGFSTDMPTTLSKANIVCLPSYREGLPRGLIEAAATARAIITTDVPGCREIVIDGKNGILVPVRNSHAISEAILLLINEPELREKMGKSGRMIAEKHFSEEDFVSRSLNVYREVVGTS